MEGGLGYHTSHSESLEVTERMEVPVSARSVRLDTLVVGLAAVDGDSAEPCVGQPGSASERMPLGPMAWCWSLRERESGARPDTAAPPPCSAKPPPAPAPPGARPAAARAPGPSPPRALRHRPRLRSLSSSLPPGTWLLSNAAQPPQRGPGLSSPLLGVLPSVPRLPRSGRPRRRGGRTGGRPPGEAWAHVAVDAEPRSKNPGGRVLVSPQSLGLFRLSRRPKSGRVPAVPPPPAPTNTHKSCGLLTRHLSRVGPAGSALWIPVQSAGAGERGNSEDGSWTVGEREEEKAGGECKAVSRYPFPGPGCGCLNVVSVSSPLKEAFPWPWARPPSSEKLAPQARVRGPRAQTWAFKPGHTHSLQELTPSLQAPRSCQQLRPSSLPYIRPSAIPGW